MTSAICWHCKRPIRSHDLDRPNGGPYPPYREDWYVFHRRRGCYQRHIDDVMEEKQQLHEMGEFPD